MKRKLALLLDCDLTAQEELAIRTNIQKKYNWDKIADQTIEIYRKVVKKE